MLEDREVNRTNWLARAILAGFCATVVMIVVFFYAYAMAVPIARMQMNDVRGALGSAADLQRYFNNLIDNPVINFAHNSLYAAFALHGVVGLLWAVLYAWLVEPRLKGPGWVRGMIFALLPWILSLVVFLPLVGGGMFGFAIGAAILPILGNFILHMAYGAVLGAVYAPASEALMESHGAPKHIASEQLALRRAEGGAVIGLGIGLVAGLGLGMLMLYVSQITQVYVILGLPDSWYVVATTMAGICLGALVGSLTTLPAA